MLSKKSFLIDRRIFSGRWRSRAATLGTISFHTKTTTDRAIGPTEPCSSENIEDFDFREIFGVLRFSTLSTASVKTAHRGQSRCKAATSERAADGDRPQSTDGRGSADKVPIERKGRPALGRCHGPAVPRRRLRCGRMPVWRDVLPGQGQILPGSQSGAHSGWALSVQRLGFVPLQSVRQDRS